MPSVLIAFPLVVLYALATWICGAAAVGIALAGAALFGLATQLALRPIFVRVGFSPMLEAARRTG